MQRRRRGLVLLSMLPVMLSQLSGPVDAGRRAGAPAGDAAACYEVTGSGQNLFPRGWGGTGVTATKRLSQRMVQPFDARISSVWHRIQHWSGTPTDAVRLTIYKGGTTPDTGDVVAGPVSVPASEIAPAGAPWTEFALGQPLRLDAGETYWYTLTRTELSDEGRCISYMRTSEQYDYSEYWAFNQANGGWDGYPTYELFLRLCWDSEVDCNPGQRGSSTGIVVGDEVSCTFTPGPAATSFGWSADGFTPGSSTDATRVFRASASGAGSITASWLDDGRDRVVTYDYDIAPPAGPAVRCTPGTTDATTVVRPDDTISCAFDRAGATFGSWRADGWGAVHGLDPATSAATSQAFVVRRGVHRLEATWSDAGGAHTDVFTYALPDSPVELRAPWQRGATYTVGGSGSFYGDNRHTGPDLYAIDVNGSPTAPADCGEPVVAARTGKVAAVVSDWTSGAGYGNNVLLDHGDGVTTRYAHLGSVAAGASRRGLPVRRGEQLGTIGRSGTGSCHLHFVLYDDGRSIPPTPLSRAQVTDGRQILSDNVPPLLMTGGSVTEHDSGTVKLRFTVVLGAPSLLPVTVDFSTEDGSAVAGQDYVAGSGTLTFLPGEPMVTTVVVKVKGDTLKEVTESVWLRLSRPSGAWLPAKHVAGAIRNDD